MVGRAASCVSGLCPGLVEGVIHIAEDKVRVGISELCPGPNCQRKISPGCLQLARQMAGQARADEVSSSVHSS